MRLWYRFRLICARTTAVDGAHRAGHTSVDTSTHRSLDRLIPKYHRYDRPIDSTTRVWFHSGREGHNEAPRRTEPRRFTPNRNHRCREGGSGFLINVPDADLTDLRRRVSATRWSNCETMTDRSQGVSSKSCKRSFATGARATTGESWMRSWSTTVDTSPRGSTQNSLRPNDGPPSDHSGRR